MQKIKCLVASENKVVGDGIALILCSAENINIMGNKGVDVVKAASELQPDLLVYELNSGQNNDLEVLTKIKNTCSWTKLILFSTIPLEKKTAQQYLLVCDGYIQGPLLPGLLLRSLELACYSGYFIFLGFAKDIKPDAKDKM